MKNKSKRVGNALKMVTASTDDNYIILTEETVDIDIIIPEKNLQNWLNLTSQISGKSVESLIIGALQEKILLRELGD